MVIIVKYSAIPSGHSRNNEFRSGLFKQSSHQREAVGANGDGYKHAVTGIPVENTLHHCPRGA